MKTTAFFILSILFSVSVKAQEAYDHYTNYYSIEAGFIGSSSGLVLGPTFSVYRGGHKIDAGLGMKIYDVWKDGSGILTTYLGYKYYPNERKNDFNLYFGYYDVLSVHNMGKRFPEVYDEASDKYRSPTYVYLLENLIGLGFDYQMGNRFYMYTDFSVGVVLDWTTYRETESTIEIRSTGLARLGVGYNIGWRKAK
ncbi:MAG: hypothetical protein K9J17_02450 [Flavobacteriales bacterium]|nr:hypothetical protein [Flavobacteriales bacterium]